MTDIQTVRKVYPDLSAKDREIFRTIVALSVLLLRSMQQSDACEQPDSQNKASAGTA